MPSTNFGCLQMELASHGVDIALSQRRLDDVAGVVRELGIPPLMFELYLNGGPENGSSIPRITEELQLFSIEDLVAAQEGYRWSGRDGRRVDEWRSEWVVIASAFGDPFFVNTDEDACPVYFALHGAGAWHVQRVAPSIDAFIGALVVFESVLLGEFHEDVWDDAGLRRDFSRMLQLKLTTVLPNDDIVNFVSVLE